MGNKIDAIESKVKIRPISQCESGSDICLSILLLVMALVQKYISATGYM